LYDNGPGKGMRWMFGAYMGAENGEIRFLFGILVSPTRSKHFKPYL